MDVGLIKNLIPQKEPFIMVDRLLYFDETTAESGFFITEDNLLSTETCFSEAGLIENMAQSVALHGGYGAYLNTKGAPKKGFLGTIKTMEIIELPKINTLIKTHIKVNHDIMGVKLSDVTVRDESGKILATATMKTATVDV